MTYSQILPEATLDSPPADLTGSPSLVAKASPAPQPSSNGEPEKEGLPQSSVLAWIGLYLLFFALPTMILFEGFRVYQQNLFEDQLVQQIESHTAELNSRRNHVSNDRVLRQIADEFREGFLRSGARPGQADNVFRIATEELPEESILFAWDGRGTLINPGSFSLGLRSDLELLARILIDGHLLFAETGGLQTEENLAAFRAEKSAQLEQLKDLVGSRFPLSQVAVGNRQLVRIADAKSPFVFYWDLFRNNDCSQGGFAFIVPTGSLSETFGLSYVVPRESGNPGFTSGFFLFGETERARHCYPGLDQTVQALLNRYHHSPETPLHFEDWVLVVLPLAEGSHVNLFCLFSTLELKSNLKETFQFGLTLSVLLLVLGILGCIHLFRQTQRAGLSIRIKLGGLFLLSMYLPLSLLSLMGLQFSLSQAKVLEAAAKDRLRRELKQVEIRAVEHYRLRGAELRALKKLPSVREVDLEKIRQLFLDMRKQISRVYLVSSEGKIVFDMDHLHGEIGRKTFISNLGRHIIEGQSLAQQTEVPMDFTTHELFSQHFLKRLATNQGVLHQIVWPGTMNKSFLFGEAVETDLGRYALILILEKQALDRDFLLRNIKLQAQRDPELNLFAISRQDLTDSIPALPPTFKAELLQLVNMAQLKEDAEVQKTRDGQRSVLLALGGGRILDDFFLGASLDYAQVMASINWLYSLTAILLAVSFSGSLLLVGILARGFLQPIGILAKGTQALTAGNLSHILPVTSNDELGELSQAFNHMTKRLRNRLHELTVLYQLTQRASTSHNQRELFELAASYLRDHLGAVDAGMGWTNEGEGLENLYLVEPREAMDSEIIRRSLVTSIQNRTFQQDALPDGRDVFSIPLFFEDKEFGGLYLIFPGQSAGNSAAGRFSADETSFIETLRHHLSLIIEKQHLFEQAITDGLTRLFVRRFFLANLEKELARGKRYKTDLALVLLDIDHFKVFNDTYGHQTGDFVLRETAQRIIENIRAVDTPGRYGGEELAIVLPQTGIDAAYIVAEKVRKAIGETSYEHQGKKLTVTVSLGVTALGPRRANVEEFIAEVDKALYAAKAKGRNRTEVACPTSEEPS